MGLETSYDEGWKDAYNALGVGRTSDAQYVKGYRQGMKDRDRDLEADKYLGDPKVKQVYRAKKNGLWAPGLG